MAPTPVFLHRESCGQRSLAGYNTWGHKGSDMTECLSTIAFYHVQSYGSSVVKEMEMTECSPLTSFMSIIEFSLSPLLEAASYTL